MKILFVSSGNSAQGISPIIKNQGMSLQKKQELSYFTIKGKGLKGYISGIFDLRNHFKNNRYDIIHAHYSLSAFVASLAGAKPLVVSLMGSDVKSKGFYKFFIKLFNAVFWKKIIVKSQDMKESLGVEKVSIIPNGVNFEKFMVMDRDKAIQKVNWDISKKHILFAANPDRPEKNYKLTKEAFDLLELENVELHYLKDVPNENMPFYFNAANVIVLTSLWEGSPNVIKESMACNIPIVATDVGDIRKVFADTQGCYLTSQDVNDVAMKLKEAIAFDNRTRGRETIKYLNENIIAANIISLYESVLTNNSRVS